MSAEVASELAHVLWLGGMSGVGKTVAARSISRRYDLRLYSLDSRTYEHAARLRSETRTLDEVWVEMEPEALADWFEDSARARFDLILSDLLGGPRDAPVFAEGPQLLPQLVAPLLHSRDQALFLVAQPQLQRQLVTRRGSLTYLSTRHPERAHENRLRRDELLADRVRRDAARQSLAVVDVGDVRETESVIERHFKPFLSEWLSSGDRGDVAARRRDENDARLRQWRAYANDVPAAAAGEIDLACECNRPACTEVVSVALPKAEAERDAARPFIVERHR